MTMNLSDIINGIIYTFIASFAVTFCIKIKRYLFPKEWKTDYINKHILSDFSLEVEYRIIENRYVQPYIMLSPNKEPKLLKDFFINKIFKKRHGPKVFCILGETGMGKTAALVNLFVDYIKCYKRKTDLPFDIWLVSLGDDDCFNKINEITNKRESILLLDAMDENMEVQSSIGYMHFLHRLEETYRQFARVIVSCRKQFFEDDKSVLNETIVRKGDDKDGTFFIKCNMLELASFNDNQVQEYLTNVFSIQSGDPRRRKANDIITRCPDITIRPLVLSFVEELVKRDEEYKTKKDIYDAVVNSLIARDVRKISPYTKDVDNRISQFRAMTSAVAEYMYKQKGRLTISADELNKIFVNYNIELTLAHNGNNKTFRQRSLLSRTDDKYQFSHKSFYEYFMAYKFFGHPEDIGSLNGMDFAVEIFDDLFVQYKSVMVHTEEEDARVALALFKIGKNLCDLNKFQKAKSKYQESIFIFQNIQKDKQNMQYYTMAKNNLAVIHRMTNENDKAEKELKELLSIRRELVKKDPKSHIADLATTLNSLANVHRVTNAPVDAAKEYNEALDIRSELAKHGTTTSLDDLAQTLTHYSGFLNEMGYVDADKKAEDAVKIYRQLAKEHPDEYLRDVAMALNNIAAIHYKTERFEDAEKEFYEALTIRNKLSEDNRCAYMPVVAKTLHNLAETHHKMGKYKAAEEEYNIALKIRRELATNEPDAYRASVAMTLNDIAVLHIDTKEFDKAEFELQESLELRLMLAEKCRNQYLPDVALTRNNMVRCYKEQGRLCEAETAAIESLEMYKEMAQINPDVFNQAVENGKNILHIITEMQKMDKINQNTNTYIKTNLYGFIKALLSILNLK